MRRPSPATVLAFIALLFAMGGFAIAANESADTAANKKKIRACVAKKGGDVRVLKASKRRCHRNEKKLVWNKRGRKGRRGPQGEVGATGLTGPQGPTGPAGSGGGGGVLGPGTVGTDHLADGSITAAKLVQNLITDDLLGLVVRYGESASNSSGSKIAYAECPVGTQLVGGGGGPTDGLLVPINPIELATSYNGPTIGNDWAVNAHEVLPLGSAWQVTAFAICIRS